MNIPPPTPKQARVMWLSLTVVAVAVLVTMAALLLLGIGKVIHRLSSVLVPMALALILAYILDPVVSFFVRKKISRLWAVCLVFVLGALLVLAVLGSVLPGLKRETRKLSQDLPQIVATMRLRVDHFMSTSPLMRQFPTVWTQHSKLRALTNHTTVSNSTPATVVIPPMASNQLDTITVTNSGQTNLLEDVNPAAISADETDSPFTDSVIPGLEKSVIYMAKWLSVQLSKITTWAEFFIGFILVPVYLFYFLLEKDSITTRWPDYLPIKDSPAKDETVFILKAINECLIVFFRGQVLVALCVGALLTGGYLILGLNYAVLLGLVAGVLGIVPYLGTITSLLLALGVAGIQFGDWTHPILVLAIAALVKLLEDFIISPRIIGERAGLHPLTIILAVMIGTILLGGFLGALLAIPLTAAMRTLMFRYIWTREYPGTKPADPKDLVDAIAIANETKVS